MTMEDLADKNIAELRAYAKKNKQKSFKKPNT